MKLTGFTEDLFEGHQAEVKVMEKRKVPASERVATMLRVPAGEEVTRFKRLRSVDGGPFSYILSYLATEIGEQISEKDLQSHTMLHLLEEKLGISLGTIRHSVESAKANIEVASLLGISVFEPVLYMETAVYSAEGQPVEVVDSFFRADRYRYTVDLIRSSAGESFSNFHRNAVVFRSHDVRVQKAGGGGQRVDARIQALLRNRALQGDGCIQVSEDRQGRTGQCSRQRERKWPGRR